MIPLYIKLEKFDSWKEKWNSHLKGKRQKREWNPMVNNKDNFVVGKIGIDHKGKINFFDQGAQEIFGYSSSEVEGQLLDILKYSSLASES